MKISELFHQNRTIFSFEFFPPKTAEGENKLYRSIRELKELSPDFVSVTYGALGTTQDKSLAVIKKIQQEIRLNVMAHYTCIGATEEKVASFLQELAQMGVDNILALRGDAPEGSDIEDVLRDTPFRYGSDLVRFIRSRSDRFAIGVAGYPEGHPECPDKDQDHDHLKMKIDAGADFIVTQLFFDNDDFFRFRDAAARKGITVPLIPGIMPLENFRQIEKITSLCGAKIPPPLRDYFSRSDISAEDKARFGIDYTTEQCVSLLDACVPGLHFYTMNRSSATYEIFKRLHS